MSARFLLAVVSLAVLPLGVRAQDAGCDAGTRVTLRAAETNDTRVFVWTSADLIDEWRARSKRAYHESGNRAVLFVRVGSHAILVKPNRSAADACVGDAVAVRILDAPYRNRYGYVDSTEIRR